MEAEAFATYLTEQLRWLHAHPEEGFAEQATTARIRDELRKAGVALLPGGTETGLVASIRGKAPGRVIGLRCDIDALPIQEESGLPYASQTPGWMHACGHDFHAAMMLGTALLLQQSRTEWDGEVKIVFQPAEELARGAESVLATGLTDDVELFLGVHSYPGFPAGTLGIREGAVMAAVDRFQITLRGRGTHAAQPHKGIDPIAAQAALVQSLQTLVSRNLDPFSAAVVSVTHIACGTTWNVLPESAFLEGTVRTLCPEDRELLRRRLAEMCEGVAAAHGAQTQVLWQAGPPAVVNNSALCALARRVALAQGFSVDRQEDTLDGEDFSRYLERRPGVFIRVGTGGTYPAHHPRFTVDPAALAPAALYFAKLARACLEREADASLTDALSQAVVSAPNQHG